MSKFTTSELVAPKTTHTKTTHTKTTQSKKIPWLKKITWIAPLILIVNVLNISGCSFINQGASCPAGDPLKIVSTIANWGSLAKELGGDCVEVTNVIGSNVADPHDFEPTVNQLSTLNDAKIAIRNGAGYDSWADKITTNNIIDVANINKVKSGANPHLWTNISYVKQAARQLFVMLLRVAGDDYSAYFSDHYIDMQGKIKKLDTKVTKLAKTKRNYVSTESCFDYLFNTIKASNKTPQTYRNATKNEGEPTVESIKDMNTAIKSAKYLLFNTMESDQTALNFKKEAEQNKVKVIEVTEAIPEKYNSIFDWLSAILDSVA